MRRWTFVEEAILKLGEKAITLHLHVVLTLIATCYMLLTASFTWNWYDVQWWVIWVETARQHGILHIYDMVPKNAYPPLLPVTFIFLYEAGRVFAQDVLGIKGFYLPHPDPAQHLGREVEVLPIGVVDIVRVFTKLPTLVANIVIGLLLYRYYGIAAMLLWYLSAPMWCTFWGSSPDSVIALLILLHVLLLRSRPALSAACLAFACLFKPGPAILIPAALAYLDSWRRRLLFLLTFILIVSTTCLPWALENLDAMLKKCVFFHAKRLPQELSLWNIPQVITWYRVLHPELTGLWTYVFIGCYVALLYLCRRLRLRYLTCACLLLLVFILTNKIGNTPYFMWVYPLLIAVYTRIRSIAVLCLMYIATVLAFMVYPGLIYFPAAALHEKIFIVEDRKWWDAYYLYVMSFWGWAYKLAVTLVEGAAVHARDLLHFIYTHLNIIVTGIILVYNGFIAFFIFRTIQVGKRLSDFYAYVCRSDLVAEEFIRSLYESAHVKVDSEMLLREVKKYLDEICSGEVLV